MFTDVGMRAVSMPKKIDHLCCLVTGNKSHVSQLPQCHNHPNSP